MVFQILMPVSISLIYHTLEANDFQYQKRLFMRLRVRLLVMQMLVRGAVSQLIRLYSQVSRLGTAVKIKPRAWFAWWTPTKFSDITIAANTGAIRCHFVSRPSFMALPHSSLCFWSSRTLSLSRVAPDRISDNFLTQWYPFLFVYLLRKNGSS